MKGREERDINNNKWLQERLNNAPRPLIDFMNTLARKETTTQKAYLGYLMDFLTYIQDYKKIDINEYDSYVSIKKMDIDAYMNYTATNKISGKRCGASIRNSKLAAVTCFFDFLVDNDIISKNPCKRVDKIRETVEKSVTYLTVEELEDIKVKILTTSRSQHYEDPWRFRDYAIFVLACTTGMRQSAIREINMGDLDLNKGEIIVTEKGNRTKTVYLSTQTKEALQQWIDTREKLLKDVVTDALFISNKRQRIAARTIQDVVSKWTNGIGKHITPHKLRSTCAMNLYEATGDIYLVAQQLGHKNIRNTQIYAKATKEKMKETANLMDKIYG